MLFLDNDTIHLLAELDLVDLLCPSLGVDLHPADVFVLRSAGDKLRAMAHGPCRPRIIRFLSNVGPVSHTDLHDDYLSIADLENVDQEALLYGCAAKLKDSTVVTGDLKSIRAVAHSDLHVVKASLKGRVRTTEQALLRIIDDVGFTEVRRRWAWSECDHAFFSKLIGKGESEVVELVTSRLNSLTSNAQELIGWRC